jgi:hypothetical protein
LKYKKLTKSKAKFFIKDEEHTSKEYAEYGYKGLSKDEARHAKFFKNKLKVIK